MPVVFFVSQPCVTTKLFENYFVTKVHVTDSICHFTHNNVTPFCTLNFSYHGPKRLILNTCHVYCFIFSTRKLVGSFFGSQFLLDINLDVMSASVFCAHMSLTTGQLGHEGLL